MWKLPELALCIAGLAMAWLGCQDRDLRVATPTEPDPGGRAGTNGGAGGTGGELDDPFGVGPRYCDLNPGAGGDACSNFDSTMGFYTEPENLETRVSPEAKLRVRVATLFSPSTALKQALEDGLQLNEFGSDVPVPFSASWLTQNGDASQTRLDAYVVVNYELVPVQALREGWHSLTIPRSARAALGASYVRYDQTLLLLGGSFSELATGDLRADFLVGNPGSFGDAPAPLADAGIPLADAGAP